MLARERSLLVVAVAGNRAQVTDDVVMEPGVDGELHEVAVVVRNPHHRGQATTHRGVALELVDVHAAAGRVHRRDDLQAVRQVDVADHAVADQHEGRARDGLVDGAVQLFDRQDRAHVLWNLALVLLLHRLGPLDHRLEATRNALVEVPLGVARGGRDEEPLLRRGRHEERRVGHALAAVAPRCNLLRDRRLTDARRTHCAHDVRRTRAQLDHFLEDARRDHLDAELGSEGLFDGRLGVSLAHVITLGTVKR